MNLLSQYDEFQSKIDEVADLCNFIPDASTEDGYKKSKRVALDVGKLRTALEKSRKDKKAESIRIGKAIDADAKEIDARLEAIQAPHKEAYKLVDDGKKAREKARVDELSQRVQSMRELPESLREADSGSVAGALEAMNAEECLDFYEFSAEALKARNYARTELAKMYSDKLQQEKDAKELAELRAAQAEQAIKDREQAAADAARLAAEKLAADQAAKIEADKQAAIEAQKAAEQREAQAKAQAEADRIAAAAKAEADKQAAIEAERKRQADELAAQEAETAAREANKRHVGAIRKTAKEALMNIDGMNEEMAKAVIMAINNGCIPAVTINY